MKCVSNKNVYIILKLKVLFRANRKPLCTDLSLWENLEEIAKVGQGVLFTGEENDSEIEGL